VKLDQQTYYFTAQIMREGHAVLRQGTLRAKDELKALDRVYDMGREIWKRSVLEVTILNPTSGEVLATSKIGEKVQQKLLPYIEDDVEENKNSGFVPWNKSLFSDPINRLPTFIAGDIGTYFKPKTFTTFVGYDT
jgi:hypothetical protein